MNSSMYLALGYRCNHHCFFCPCGKKKGTVCARYEDIEAAIEYATEELGVNHITLSGGEPTLHNEFPRIIQKCIVSGANVTVLTNGDLLHNYDFAYHCFNGVDPKRVSVVSAIHASLPEEHDRVTGIAGSFERTIEGIKNVLSLRIPVEIKQCVSAWNYKHLPIFPSFLLEKFGPQISATIVGMDFCGMDLDDINKVAIGYRDMAPYIERMLDCVDELRHKYRAFPRFSVCDLPLCPVDPYYWKYYAKSSRRELAQYSAPSVNTAEFKTSFHVVSQCDTFFKACSECKVNSLCPGAWRTAYEFFGEGEAHAI